MSSRVIKNCPITHADSEVLRYPNFQTSPIKNYSSAYPGVNVKANEVYSPCFGVVVFKSNDDKTGLVVIQYSGNISLVFSHMKQIFLDEGDLVYENQLIGYADRYVKFEYLTSEPHTPAFRFYLPNRLVLYKHDPMLVLNRNIVFQNQFENSSIVYLNQALYEDGPEYDI